MPKPETKLGKVKFIIGLCGEVVGLGLFYGAVVVGIFILCGLNEKSTSVFIYIVSAVVIGGVWLTLRIKKIKQGRYYLNEL